MSPLAAVVVATLGMCAAVALVVSAVAQPRRRLELEIRHLHRDPTDRPGETATVVERLGAMAATTAFGARTTGWTRPLRLIGVSTAAHLGGLVMAATVGFVLPALALGVARWLGLVSVSVFVPLGVALLAALALPAAIHSDAMSRSQEVAVDVRHQLSAYLDMVTMLLAGNTGYEGALEQAARAGDGLLFVELRRRMREVSTTGHSLVGALSLVADDLGIVELEQVAAAARLSAAEGAPVARTLAAKCSTLRSTLAADQEANARIRTDKVTPPLVGMAVLFMALIIYPALQL